MGMTFKEFAEGGNLTVFESGAGAPDLNAFMVAAEGKKPSVAAPPPVPRGPGM